MQEYKDFILNEVIFPVYENLIDCEEFTTNELELSLPLFLNTGDAVDIVLEYKSEGKIILKNRLHLLLEEALKDKISFINLRKKYFFNNEKIKIIEKEYISDKGIKNTLLQEKEVTYKNVDDLKKEIFIYLFSVIRFNNYIYDYIINNLKTEELKQSFSEEIERFVNYYNEKNCLNLNKIDKIEQKLVSDNNEYYLEKEKLLTGVNDKVHFLEAVRDIEVLKKKYNIEELVIVQSRKGKNGLNEKYMQKFLNAKYEYIDNNLNLDFKE